MTTPPMTEERMAEITMRCERATSGPWTTVKADMPPGFAVPVAAVAPGPQHRVFAVVSGGTRPAGDQDFIAHARQDIPDLLAEVKRLRAESREKYAERMALLERTIRRACAEWESWLDHVPGDGPATSADREALAECREALK